MDQVYHYKVQFISVHISKTTQTISIVYWRPRITSKYQYTVINEYCLIKLKTSNITQTNLAMATLYLLNWLHHIQFQSVQNPNLWFNKQNSKISQVNTSFGNLEKYFHLYYYHVYAKIVHPELSFIFKNNIFNNLTISTIISPKNITLISVNE